jgi:hypothetical protein
MCKYRYKNKNSNVLDNPCQFPDFYDKHNKEFNESLLIDNDGFCIFHSSNAGWKIEHDFREKLFELINVISEVHKKTEVHEWNYFLDGFHFPHYESIVFDESHFNNAVVMSNCIFDCSVYFDNMTLNSLDIEHSIFNKIVSFNKVVLINSIFSNYASFYGGLNFTNCYLEKYLYFENCTFYNIDEFASRNIGIKDCKHVHFLSFKKSTIKTKVYIKNATFNYELNFDNCVLEDEFSMEKCQVNGIISFKDCEFSLTENPNPMMSGTHFSYIDLNEGGKIIFKGKSPEAEMMKNELSLHFKERPKGLIVFENFNLNTIYPEFRASIPELQKDSIVEIGRGCQKYYCTTDTITINASNSTQKLILDIASVFCNYFEIQNGYNLGIEIIERTKSQIRYFYFTDEAISKEDFIDRIKQNENNLWQTFSKLTQNAREVIPKYHIEITSCLIDIAAIFLKIGNQIEYNKLSEQSFDSIFNSISVVGKSIIDTQSLLKEIRYRGGNLNNIAPIIKIENMGNNYTNYGTVENFGENNYKTSISENPGIPDEQKVLIYGIIDEIIKEREPKKKESKLKKFIKDYGPTIGESAVKIISSIT